jgi:hypothetical protein
MRDRTEDAERQFVLHLVDDAGASSLGDEAVLVTPQLVRTFELHIDKPMRRLPFDNFGGPVNRENSPAQGVLDQSSFADGSRVNTQNAKVEEGGRELLQVRSFREEFKHLIKRPGNNLLSTENEWRHLLQMHRGFRTLQGMSHRVRLLRMTRDPLLREGLHSADQAFLASVQEHGWSVTKVFKSEGEAGPEWAFSTGLFHSYQHAEIVIFGLPLDTMHKIINNIGDEVKKGDTFGPDKEYQEIFAKCVCRFREVKSRHFKDYLGWAMWFYEHDPFPVLQCFWPDKEGKYPWEPGCSQAVISAQPFLFEE